LNTKKKITVFFRRINMNPYTGAWKKKKRTQKDMAHFFRNPTDDQLLFLHELASVHLGEAPSMHFGHQRIPIKMKAHPEVWKFIKEITSGPKHMFGRRLLKNKSINKKAGSIVSSVVGAATNAYEAVKPAIQAANEFQEAYQGEIQLVQGVIGAGSAIYGAAQEVNAEQDGDAGGRIREHTHALLGNINKYRTGSGGSGWIDFK